MNKRRLQILLILSFLCCTVPSFAHPADSLRIYLSNYSFPATQMKGTLCRILGDNVDQYTPALTGANADLFKLKKNELFSKQEGKEIF